MHFSEHQLLLFGFAAAALLVSRIPVLGKFFRSTNTLIHESGHALLTLLTSGNVVSTGTSSVSFDIDGADQNNGYYQLEEGETYEMTVTVDSYNPTVSGTYHLQVLSVGFADSEITATDTEVPADLSDYESDDVAIQS